MSPPRGERAAPRDLCAELAAARERTDGVLARVPPALIFERPIAERHRLAFYLGHLEAFDLNLLLRRGVAPDAGMDRLFAFGIDPVDGALPADRPQDWPPIESIRDYARQARQRVDERVASRDLDPLLLHAAIEHRLMHAETLAYLLDRLPLSRPLPTDAAPIRSFGDDDVVKIPAGVATLGARAGEHAFAWDNEFDAHAVEVLAFAIDRHMVTRAQFHRFVEAGSYDDPRWWTAENWAWRCENHVVPPADRPGDWPVYVSHAQASAYARWRECELPSEAQWHRAAYGTRDGRERRYPWGDAEPDASRGNFDFVRWGPLPVDAHPAGASAFGVAGLLGNGWEWTSTPFAPFAGFTAHDFYPGYSADFFDGRHFVLKGGSAHTAARLLRRSFRNWFQPRYPYAFAGFRCVRPL
jgi:iron(II)-dependent oxidoreductase